MLYDVHMIHENILTHMSHNDNTSRYVFTRVENFFIYFFFLRGGGYHSESTTAQTLHIPAQTLYHVYTPVYCTVLSQFTKVAILESVGGWVNQAYSRFSTTHGHITDCKLDSVVYAGVCV